jgi:hypothetical protein
MPKEIDHKAEALRLLSDADDARCNEEPDLADGRRFEALVLSNLSIAEGQERVAEELRIARRAPEGLSEESEALWEARRILDRFDLDTQGRLASILCSDVGKKRKAVDCA